MLVILSKAAIILETIIIKKFTFTPSHATLLLPFVLDFPAAVALPYFVLL